MDVFAGRTEARSRGSGSRVDAHAEAWLVSKSEVAASGDRRRNGSAERADRTPAIRPGTASAAPAWLPGVAPGRPTDPCHRLGGAERACARPALPHCADREVDGALCRAVPRKKRPRRRPARGSSGVLESPRPKSAPSSETTASRLTHPDAASTQRRTRAALAARRH